MMFRRILIISAIIVAILLSVNQCMRLRVQANTIAGYVGLTEDSPVTKFLTNISLKPKDLPEYFYPFAWQKSQRMKLRSLLQLEKKPSVGNDELALARLVWLAEVEKKEEIYREGILREPNNALFHYLLADMYIRQGLTGKGPITDKDTGEFHYDYTITDRQKLDLSMQEMAIGLQLPFLSHRDALIRAQLDATPSDRGIDSIYSAAIEFSSLETPEFSAIRNFARVNGFYLQTLLAEGKREEAEPFLYTGTHLVVQVSNDTPIQLIPQLVAIAVGAICRREDVRACRSFGYDDEADMIDTQLGLLITKPLAWKDSIKTIRDEGDRRSRMYGGVLAKYVVIPGFPVDEITKDSLRSSRLAEYALAEGAWATGLSLLSFLLMLYSGLKYWRWKLASRGEVQPEPEVVLSRGDWLRIIVFGLLSPIALYLVFISIPAISGRDYGIGHSIWQFVISFILFLLWSLIVPATIAIKALRRKSISHSVMLEENRGARFKRIVTTFLLDLLCLLAACYSLFLVTYVLLIRLLATRPIITGVGGNLAILAFIFLPLALMLLPAIWERKRTEAAPYNMAMAFSMVPVYAVMTLFFGLLVPVSYAFERHYVMTDQLTSTMRVGDVICYSKAEGRIVIQLRQTVR
ncbi:MAG: hypothetical protein WCJ56_11025, partial [bacterium]